jgi:RecA-family ATPase
MGGMSLPPERSDGLTFSKVAAHATKIPGQVEIAGWHGARAPERRWIVDGLIPEGAVTILAGDGGIGKTLLALQLVGACTLGKLWLGRPTRPCKAIAVCCEDDEEELWRRLEAVAAYYGAAASDFAERLRLFSRIGLDNLLMTWPNQYGQGETLPLCTQISNLAIDHGAELVVLDALHDFFAGDENKRPQARQFIAGLQAIAMEIKGAVLLNAHPSVAGRNTGTGESGSTAWNNAVRSRLYFTTPKREEGQAEPSNGLRELKTVKANYTAAGGRIMLRWQDGVFVANDPASGGMVASLERNRVDNIFLACLDAVRAQGRWVSAAATSPDYAPKIFVRMPQARGYSKPDLARAMEALFASGRIKTAEVGKLSNRLPRMGIVRAEKEDDGNVS